jgi:hypothetical protein
MTITQTAGARQAKLLKDMYSKLLNMTEEEIKALASVTGVPDSLIQARLDTERRRRAHEADIAQYIP